MTEFTELKVELEIFTINSLLGSDNVAVSNW